VLVIAIVLQLARLGWSVSSDVLWAEDGAIFLHQAVTQSFFDAITQTYSEYLVVIDHLIVWAATLVPLRDTALAISILSAAVVGITGLAVWLASAAYVRNLYLRGTLAVVTVLAPFAGVESLNSASYVAWFMLFACFWLLLWRPAGWGGTTFAAIFLLLTGLSSPGVWFFLPLVVLRVIAMRDHRDVAILAGWAMGAFAQVLAILLSNEAVVDPAWSHYIPTDYLQRVVTEAPFGLRLGGDLWIVLGWALPTALAVAGLIGLSIGLRRSTVGARWVAGLAVAISVAMFVAAIYQRAVGLEVRWPSGSYHELYSRYVIVPALLLISAAIVLLDSSTVRAMRQKWFPWAAGGTVGILLISVAVSFWTQELNIRGVPWKSGIDQAASRCVAEGTENVQIPIAPAPTWFVELPCDEVVGASSYRAPSNEVGGLNAALTAPSANK
jgi:hypothetical protein